MTSHPFLNTDWQQIFADNNLADFDALWDLKAKWFEEPNVRRGGWSGVVRVELDSPQGKVGVFIKRQENHITKTLLHPFKGRPTFEREFKSILQLRKHNIPTLEPIFFSSRNLNGNLQAILITKELSGYIPLESDRFLATGDLLKDAKHKYQLFSDVANTVRVMHHHNYQHNCLYLKHLFIKADGDSWKVKMIDLEKLKWRFFKRKAIFRDLYSLHRHAKGWSTKDHVAFFKIYLQEEKLSAQSKKLWHAIATRIKAKQK